jgi:uncharacterized repeat protein (TIGR01451 family)
LGNFGVTGTVTIVNANGFDVPFTITDSLDDDSGVTLNCPSQTVLADDELVCTFSAAPSDASATEFDATVTPDELLDPQSTTASVDFVENLIGDDTVVVDDDRDTDEQFPAEISDSQTFTYDETFPCSANRADYTNLLDTDTYVNTATLTGENTDLSDAADVTVTCEIGEIEQQAPPIADIAVTKTATPTVVNPGGNTTWTLVARNNGPDAADNAAIVDNLPSTLTLVSFTSPAGWDCSGTVTGNPGKLSCTKPSMAVNESATFTLTTTVTAAAGTTINNTAVVSTSTGETTTANNQDSEPITVAVAVLPPTGAGHVWDRLAIAAGLVLAGGLLLAVDRRRRIIS